MHEKFPYGAKKGAFRQRRRVPEWKSRLPSVSRARQRARHSPRIFRLAVIMPKDSFSWSTELRVSFPARGRNNKRSDNGDGGSAVENAGKRKA